MTALGFSRLRVPALFLALASLPACVGIHRWQKAQTQKHREIELADVAKSWCQTIRASQVIPVYPLTEDLQPGDVFLVRRTVEDQADEYKTAGFLPLDYHWMRLDPAKYGEFYSHSVLAPAPVGGAPTTPLVPAGWMRPAGVPSFPGPKDPAWHLAPSAAFAAFTSFASSEARIALSALRSFERICRLCSRRLIFCRFALRADFVRLATDPR